MADWKKCEAVEQLPGKMSGAWVAKGTRIDVGTILANAADGHTPAELAEMFPGLLATEAARIIEFATQKADAGTA